MYFSDELQQRFAGKFRAVKVPASGGAPAQRDPAVIGRVSSMLDRIRAEGLPAVLGYAAELDGHDGSPVEVSRGEMEQAGSLLAPELRHAIELGAARTRAFAEASRAGLGDLEVELEPGLVAGYRYLPVQGVGAYLPAGRFPLTASAFMTVNVAKVAGVPHVMVCTPPQDDGAANPAVLYAAVVSGVDQVFLLGGVQALAAMAFGLVGDSPIDMLVGAGNAFVAEAKRQLFGTVAIDLLAGPSEVAVIADHSADPVIVAADLLGQAEHGPDSPAALITTSVELAHAVASEIDRQLASLTTAGVAGPAWRNHGSITVADDKETAAALMDDLAPEHLEIQTTDDDWYHDHLRAYGSLFLGPWSTVAYSDKGMAGTNHVLPTAGGARHSAGVSVARFLRPLTYQRVTRAATPLLADAVEVISASEGMAAHRATATLRQRSYRAAGDPALTEAAIPFPGPTAEELVHEHTN